MRILTLNLERWGALSGRFELDPERVSVLALDTERERWDLAAGLSLLLTGSRGPAGRGTAEIVARVQGVDERVCWSVESSPREMQSLVACDWLIDDARLNLASDPGWVMQWLRELADGTRDGASVETVRAALLARREGYQGLLVENGPVDHEIHAVDLELARIAGQAQSLEEDRRIVARGLEEIRRMRQVIHALEVPLRSLEAQEARTNLEDLAARIEVHRATHQRVKQIRSKLASMGDYSAFPGPQFADRIQKSLGEAVELGIARDTRDEQVKELSDQLSRISTSRSRREWVGHVDGRLTRDLVRREAILSDVTARRDAIAQLADDLRRHVLPDGTAVSEFEALHGVLGGVTADERRMLAEGLPTLLNTLVSFSRLSGGMSRARAGLSRVQSVEPWVRAASVLMGAFGLGLSVGLPSSAQAAGFVDHTPLLVGVGIFILFMGVATWSTADSILSGRRTLLEGKVSDLQMPMELEGLRLSLMELRVEETCRRLGYGAAEDLEGDLVRYDRMASAPVVSEFIEVRGRLAELESGEVAAARAGVEELLQNLPVPPDDSPLLAARWAVRELTTGKAGEELAASLAGRLAAARSSAESALKRWEASRAMLIEGVAACGLDPGDDPAGRAAELTVALRQQVSLHAQWTKLHDGDLTELLPTLLTPSTLRRVLRKVRGLARKLLEAASSGLEGPGQGSLAVDRQMAQDLAMGRFRLEAARERLDRATRVVRDRLASYRQRLPELLQWRSRLLVARTEAVRLRDAVSLALDELEAAVRPAREHVLTMVRERALPRVIAHRPTLQGLTLSDRLEFDGLPGDPAERAQVSRLAYLSMLAVLAARTEEPGAGRPLVLIEPLESEGAYALADLLSFVGSRLLDAQMLILTRRRSRYESLRFDRPALFRRIQQVALLPVAPARQDLPSRLVAAAA